MKISSNFAPPLGIISPFFIAGVLFYILSIVGLFTLESRISWLDLHWIGFVHTYLIGFVMLVIIGAMAQLLPVVLERGHCCVGFYPIIFTFIALGTLLLLMGFLAYPLLLSYGGLIIVLGFAIFGMELILTGKDGLWRSLSTRAVSLAILFLTIGTVLGWIMTLGLAGVLEMDPSHLIDVHATTLLAGGVMLILIGLAQILLPMFGLAHGFDTKPAAWAFGLIVFGAVLYLSGEIIASNTVQTFAMVSILAGVGAHIVQVVTIARKKGRREYDIWFRSLAVAYLSLVLSLGCLIFALTGGDDRAWILSGWLFGVGFLGFMITGHLYKIIPFLVWFERFSPLVGKQKVPMLHQMVPKRSADFQWGYSSVGLFVAALSLLFENNDLWYGGLSFLLVGSLFLIHNITWMLRFK